MMLDPPMNKLLEQVPSRYMLVNVVAQRARQIASDAEESGLSLDDKPVNVGHPRGGGGQSHAQAEE